MQWNLDFMARSDQGEQYLELAQVCSPLLGYGWLLAWAGGSGLAELGPGLAREPSSLLKSCTGHFAGQLSAAPV